MVFAAAIFTGCDFPKNAPIVSAANDSPHIARNMNQSTARNIEIKTDIESLRDKINLPREPVEVQWTEEIFDNSKGAAPAPSDQRLTALLRYDSQTAAELTRQLDVQSAEKSLGNAEIKDWFPTDVKNLATEINGKTKLVGAKFSPAEFYRGAYRNGTLIRVNDSNYFVLSLFSF